ncbi:related to Vacuolar transporter chaperone 3 [Saccharomycodes ludwigii]|uniref:Related to Vacuolar transporter chaperone 3 n=1 Tax=Saccharomycodes ludwigii TaxID=36035 RepID=A0A376B1S5_9ASCO|nr:hypothetical protein SCDLUD_000700 [Saccharomycodes ludwigii]KAH3903089.1 hypothetical protein SCDLUD_000700 [Saccharomycodes ludwigii]SSD58424.1 related to Vacuolar transporter chaperone 3 [Saccharomycodes ludwigii]
MLFGVKLANDIYPPWRDSYINYDKLKNLLKEQQASKNWTDKDESEFVSVLDEELEKVYTFQTKKYHQVMEKLNKLEDETDDNNDLSKVNMKVFHDILETCLNEAQELDNFSRLNFTGFTKIVKKHDKLHPNYPSVRSLLQVRLKELPFHSEEYSPLLYKISYLYNIFRCNNPSSASNIANSTTSALGSKSLEQSFKLNSVSQSEENVYDSFKFWIHPDNLMEVKTRILRHLPVLVYAAPPNENDDLIDRLESNLINGDIHNFNEDELSYGGSSATSSDADNSKKSLLTNNKNGGVIAASTFAKAGNGKGNGTAKKRESGSRSKANYYDPVITTIYFDNTDLELYNDKLLKTNQAPTLRLRWTGRLANKPDVFLEERVHVEDSVTHNNDFDETRIQIKPKFISGFIRGNREYKDKSVAKLRESGNQQSDLAKLEHDFDSIQSFITTKSLEPVLRAMYIRTAFQIPGDDRIRVTIDSDILYIREDSFDQDRPVRDPRSWHRTDIDSSVANPLKFLRVGEFFKFPFSVMEIKVKRPAAASHTNFTSPALYNSKHSKWISELTNSHLVKEVPKFSKFVQGIASLFGEDDKLDILPFWLPDLESDIKKDPQQAYEEEKKKLKKQKEAERRVSKLQRFSVVSSSGTGNMIADNMASNTADNTEALNVSADIEDHESSEEEDESNSAIGGSSSKNKKKTKKNKKNRLANPKFFQVLTNPKLTGVDSEDDEFELPAGVKKPTQYLKNAGPVKVEAKVWLANERTFNKWLSVTTLLSALTFSIYSSVKRAAFPHLADTLAYIYFGLTIFTGLWSYRTFTHRLNVIRERSGQHLDAPLGPLLVALVVAVTLCVNFVVAFRESYKNRYGDLVDNNAANVFINSVGSELPNTLKPIQEFIYKVVGAASASVTEN